jgi:enamine deaminase RidA (YjgF/YER057c/UK114 family)
VHQLARNHVAVLEAAGLSLEDIVSGYVYLNDMDDYQPMNSVYRQYFSRGPGVRTCLMPNSARNESPLRVLASFTAARTQ